MNLREVREKTEKFHNDLRLDKDGDLFDNAVHFVHMDRSECKFTNSFVKLEKCVYSEEEKWVCIHTEHHGWKVYCSDELKLLIDKDKTWIEGGLIHKDDA